MPQDSKRPSAIQSRSSSFASLLLGWAQQGVDSFLATQRILADFATRRSASAMKSLREGVSESEHSPMTILTELAVEATANFTEAQRVLLNLAQRENDIVMAGVKERVSASATAAALTERVRRGIDTVVEMQQDFLTIASKHAQERLQSAQAGKGPEVSCLVDAAREAMDNFVRAQKKFLDVIAENGAKPRKHEETAKKKTEISKLAREAAGSFIDAQKKLLDLAGQQVNVNLQAASRAMELVNALRPRPLPNLTGEGVKSFVEAEKAVIETFMKPGEEKAEGRGARRGGRRRAAAAQAAPASA